MVHVAVADQHGVIGGRARWGRPASSASRSWGRRIRVPSPAREPPTTVSGPHEVASAMLRSLMRWSATDLDQEDRGRAFFDGWSKRRVQSEPAGRSRSKVADPSTAPSASRRVAPIERRPDGTSRTLLDRAAATAPKAEEALGGEVEGDLGDDRAVDGDRDHSGGIGELKVTVIRAVPGVGVDVRARGSRCGGRSRRWPHGRPGSSSAAGLALAGQVEVTGGQLVRRLEIERLFEPPRGRVLSGRR